MDAIHHHAAGGFAKGAGSYARGRPDYPKALETWLRDRIGLGAGKVALDLGAGTGKFTRLLADTGARVIAVEPVAEMITALSAAMPTIEAHRGTATAIPLGDAAVDAVLCAQAFHWFAASAALDEIHRVLRPGGTLALIWNVRDERVDWVARLGRIIAPYEAGAPRFVSGEWRRVFPHSGFGVLEEQSFPHGHTGAPEHVVLERILSVSFIAALPRDDYDRVIAEVRALMAGEPALRDRTEVTMPYNTAVFTCTRL